MNGLTSLYFDIVRILAAFMVYLYHSNQRDVVQQILPLSNYGHSAVVVFFVLSGFVIAFVADKKERTPVAYFAARISRVFSVALPAVFLTVLLDSITRLYTNLDYPFDQHGLRLAISSMMLNEVWFLSVTHFSNVPYWSITYEFWYYIIFGLGIFIGGRKGLLIALAVGIMIGPKLLLLFPVWYSGVWLYRSNLFSSKSKLAMLNVFGSTIILIIAFHIVELQSVMQSFLQDLIGQDLHRELTFSKFFLSDYILALLIVVNFASVRRLGEVVSFDHYAMDSLIKSLAGYTFTFYLMHQPLFLFWNALVGFDPNGYSNWFFITSCVFASTYLLGIVTEKKRFALKLVVERVFKNILVRRPQSLF